MRNFKALVLDSVHKIVESNVEVSACSTNSAVNKLEKMLNISGVVILYSETGRNLGSYVISKIRKN